MGENMVSTKEESLWSGTACRVAVNAISHPIEYAKVLIQVLGHWFFNQNVNFRGYVLSKFLSYLSFYIIIKLAL